MACLLVVSLAAVSVLVVSLPAVCPAAVSLLVVSLLAASLLAVSLLAGNAFTLGLEAVSSVILNHADSRVAGARTGGVALLLTSPLAVRLRELIAIFCRPGHGKTWSRMLVFHMSA